MPFLFRMCANGNIFRRFRDTLRILFYQLLPLTYLQAGDPGHLYKHREGRPPDHTLHGRGGGCVRPRGHYGVWEAEVSTGQARLRLRIAFCDKRTLPAVTSWRICASLCLALPQAPRDWIAMARDSSLALLYLSLLLSISRCIGSIQHLKSKFGKDYLLEMKVKTLTQVESLNTEIMKIFPQAARQER